MEFLKYKELNILQKTMVKAFGGYEKYKQIMLKEEQKQDKLFYDLLANGTSVYYSKKDIEHGNTTTKKAD